MPLAATLIAPRTMELRNRGALKPESNEVVIAVDHAGICGTDLALFSGDYNVSLPLVCGHEFVGTVASAGDGVDRSWLGKRVTAEINNTCIAYNNPSPCPACTRGMSHHCMKRTVTGIIAHNGAFAEEVAVPAGTLYEVPATVDPVTATLTEPLAAALQTFVMTPAQESETVVVQGAGRLGILIVFVAALRGLNVIAISRSETKCKRALQFGASEAWTPDQAEAKIREATEGLGADIVVEATGQSDGIQQALKWVRPRGTLSVKTTCGLSGGKMDWTRLVVDEICIQGSRCGPFEPALKILAKHQEKLRKLITCLKPLTDVQKAMESAAHEDKIILNMD